MIQLGRLDELGSGVRNINKYLPLCANGAKPIFKETKQLFRLTLPLTNNAKIKVTDQGAQLLKTTVKILELIRENKEITRQELADKLDMTIDGIDWNIRKLKKEGMLERIGPDKGGHWKVLE